MEQEERIKELEQNVRDLQAAMVALLEDSDGGWSRDNGFEVLHRTLKINAHINCADCAAVSDKEMMK